ncbi:hypothetical protein B0H14DRAFT_3890423 [Mycena olivaceomarginata]|nr:hypothetical protein B0H14DRAFT_3890423 [Mycena olivaceomarginata]
MRAIAPPPESNTSNYSTMVKTTDGRCAVSGETSRLQSCHLVPEAEAKWWLDRGMFGLTLNRQGINSPQNSLAMRDDLNAQGDEALLLTDGDVSSDDAAPESPFDVSAWTECDLEVTEGLDADLHVRRPARYEQAMGVYPGFSKVMRLEHKYRQEHPEVSAVWSARVAYVGEYDDEQRF